MARFKKGQVVFEVSAVLKDGKISKVVKPRTVVSCGEKRMTLDGLSGTCSTIFMRHAGKNFHATAAEAQAQIDAAA